MKFKNVLELLKQLGYVSVNVLWEIVKNLAGPIYTTTVKILLIALVVWALCLFVPHGLPFLKEVSYIGWATIIAVWRLLNVRYDDFDDEEDFISNKDVPPYLQDDPNKEDELPPEQPIPQAPSNIAKELRNDNYSTRE
jgi:predicted membrane protein